MKKTVCILLISYLSFSLFTTPLYANEEKTSILVSIENSEDFYLLEIYENKMNIKIISSKTYIPISALNNEASTLNSVNFSVSYEILLNSIETFLEEEIPYYVHIEIEPLLKQLNLSEDLYKEKTLRSLCESALQIKKNMNLNTLINYKKYIKTNLTIKQIYSFYMKFKNNKINYSYYTLPYLIYEDCYIPMERTFYLKEKVN